MFKWRGIIKDKRGLRPTLTPSFFGIKACRGHKDRPGNI